MTIEIDDDVRAEYWNDIRNLPDNSKLTKYKSAGKSKQEREKIEKSVRRHDMDRRFRAPGNSG